jgi:Mg2+ and Co2+ transporter CorA
VTGRRHRLHSAQHAREAIEQGIRFSCPCNVLEAMAECVLDKVGELTDALERELDLVEDRILVRGARGDEERRLTPLRHKLVRHNRQLSKFSAALSRFVAWAAEAELPEQSHAAAARLIQRTEPLRHDVEAMQERARLLQEEASDRRAAEMNRHLYVLSILTAVLMPPTLVAGIFGMNTAGLPFEGSSDGFLAALVLGLASSGLIYWLLHRVRKRSGSRP